jgi:peroxiredoxin
MKNDKSRIASGVSFLNLQKWPAALTLFVIFVAITPPLCAQRDVHAELIAPVDRKPAPAFRLVAETGKITSLSDYRGKVVLLNFWASDCGGCVLEIPSIIVVQASYKPKRFTVVGVSMDISYDNLKNAKEAWGKVRPFMTKSKINYPILMGNAALFKRFGLTQLPDTFLIDKTGRIAAVYVGLIDKGNVEANIGKLLLE